MKLKMTPKDIAAATTCAVLYAVGSFMTAYISSPWGRGQLRPAVIIPGVYAVIFGPLPAALGAALGTLICDSVKHMQLYIPSLLGAAPGNFIGFYIFGKLLEGKFNWRRFVTSSVVSLAIGCTVVAFLYTATISMLGFLPPILTTADLAYLASALTIWFFITEFPFMLLLGPPLIRAICAAFPFTIPSDVRKSSLKSELPKRLFAFALLLPGTILLTGGLMIAFTPIGQALVYGLAVKLTPSSADMTLQLIRLLFVGTGAAMSGVGAAILARQF